MSMIMLHTSRAMMIIRQTVMSYRLMCRVCRTSQAVKTERVILVTMLMKQMMIMIIITTRSTRSMMRA